MVIIYLNNLLTFQAIDLALHPHGASWMFLWHFCCLFNLSWHAWLNVTPLKLTYKNNMNFETKKKRRKNTIPKPWVSPLGTWSNSVGPIFTFGNFPLAVPLTLQSAIITTVNKTGRFAFYIVFCSSQLQGSWFIAVLGNFFPLPFWSDFISCWSTAWCPSEVSPV